MIAVEEHLASVLALAGPLRAVRLPLADCLGLVLAEDVVSRLAVPPFTNSAMDGFAVRAADVAAAAAGTPVELRVIADVPAGTFPNRKIGPGEAARVMTGAPVPAGADAVIPTELTDQPLGDAPLPPVVAVAAGLRPGQHVREVGEDVPVGAAVLDVGSVLTPAALAAAASVGWGDLLVRPPVRVAVLATGSELVPPGVVPGPGQIPDSNSVLVGGMVGQAGAVVTSVERTCDEVDAFSAALDRALAADLVITTGGVSVGAFDVVRQVRARGRLDFRNVAMQPGKPQGVGLLDAPDGRAVGLLAFPGNPVSVFVSFALFARPLLAVMSGRPGSAAPVRATAGVGWRSPAGRRQYVPVRFEAGRAVPSHRLGSGSHLVASLPAANALAIVPEDVLVIEAGDELDVMGV